jgi:hypothetical protein
MMFNKLGIVKMVATGIVGIGTGKIIGQIIKNNTAAPETLIDRVTMTAAAWVISSVVTAVTKKHADEMIDEFVNGVTKTVDKFKTADKLNRINKGQSTFSDEGLDQAKFRKDEDDRWVPISDEDYKSNQGIDETATN